MRINLLVLVLTALGSTACGGYFKTILKSELTDKDTILSDQKPKPTDTSRGALGQGFELHKIDLLSKQLQATGAKVFESLDMEECTLTDPLGSTSKDDTFYKSTESLYSSLQTKTNIKGSFYVFGGSVSAVTGNIASEKVEISGKSLNMKAYSLATGLKKDCINKKPLAKDLVKDFEKLEKAINNPHKAQSWRTYNVFLEKYGSHIVREALSGASIYQYVFAKKTKKFTEKEFTANACGKLAGKEDAADAGNKACADVTKKDVEETEDEEMSDKLVVRGGKAETRNKLTGDLSKDQINKFMNEGQTDPSPIQYEFYPIWTILKSRYIGTDHYCKAVNLEQFYKGFLIHDCSYTKSNDQELQKFVLADDSDPDAPTYECQLAPEGCHSSDDCHTKNLVSCVVHGSSAVRYNNTEQVSGETKKVAYIFTEEDGDDWEGPGCGKKGFKCKCIKEQKKPTISWSSESDSDQSLRDIHHMLVSQRRDEEKRAKKRTERCKKAHM